MAVLGVPRDLADLLEPSKAAAAAGPAVAKLATDDSSVFFLCPKSEPRKPSFSFFLPPLPSLSLSLSFLSFLPNKPDFFSFSLGLSFLSRMDDPDEDAMEGAADALLSVRARGGRESRPSFSCDR